MLKQYLEAGRITTSHGVRGEVKLAPWADSPTFFLRLPALYATGVRQGERLEIEHARVAGSMVLLKLKGYDTPEQAAVLRNMIVLFDRADAPLPAGQCFLADLEGLTVLDDMDEHPLGTVVRIESTGFQNLLVVRTADGAEHLVPLVPAFLTRAVPEEGKLWLHIIPGLLDGAPEEIQGE